MIDYSATKARYREQVTRQRLQDKRREYVMATVTIILGAMTAAAGVAAVYVIGGAM